MKINYRYNRKTIVIPHEPINVTFKHGLFKNATVTNTFLFVTNTFLFVLARNLKHSVVIAVSGLISGLISGPGRDRTMHNKLRLGYCGGELLCCLYEARSDLALNFHIGRF